MIKALTTLALALFLTACATTYQSQGFTGGFSEVQLAENIWRVTFIGNGFTNEQRAADLALLRSADLTLEQGYSHFSLIEETSDIAQSTFTTPSSSYTTANAYGYGNYAYGTATTTTYGGQTFVMRKPSSTNTILMLEENPDGQGIVYDASFICRSLGDSYNASCFNDNQ